ncbi:E3 ubiquitin-protein ligase MARCH3 [Coturnix japonica]|uniref:E3 ubiquitin-protein ligase MARCH3 n=1 Tax=Coturnix japonica TaxID=93934 RepID=UPI0013A5CCB8|nr:E3 ubiquitin-protein ligase MARCH3 [Coturnix japonica]
MVLTSTICLIFILSDGQSLTAFLLCSPSAAPTVSRLISLKDVRPRYVMDVAAKDGQLLCSVVPTLATQRVRHRYCSSGEGEQLILSSPSPCSEKTMAAKRHGHVPSVAMCDRTWPV